MCLLVLAWCAHPRYALIVAANRDEYHERPAAPLSKWPSPHEILAGRDLRAAGTWLALDRQRRFGVVTNFRDLQPKRPEAPSRGDLVPAYLVGSQPPEEFLAGVENRAAHYSGFNLLLSDRDSLWYASNRAERFTRPLSPGVYGLSNEFLDTPWPKLRRVRRRFEAWLSGASRAAAEELFRILEDRTPAAEDERLPETGLAPEWEHVLSAPFVVHPKYGTRCTTVLLLDTSGALYMAERRFDPAGQATGQSEFALNAGEWPSE